MSLTIPAAPQEAVTALAAALRGLAISPMVAARLPHAATAIKSLAIERAATPASQPAISLGFFVLDLADISKGIMAARQVGWRHLLSTGDSASPALADTAIRSSGQHVFAALTESPFASDLQARLAALGGDPAVGAGSYSAALLQVPACNVMAIWLRDTTSKEDLFVPVAPAPPPLMAGRQYSVSEFLGALRPAS